MDAEWVELEVRLNGTPLGRVSVSSSASKRELELAALSMRAVQERIGEATVKGFTVIEDGAVNISV